MRTPRPSETAPRGPRAKSGSPASESRGEFERAPFPMALWGLAFDVSNSRRSSENVLMSSPFDSLWPKLEDVSSRSLVRE
eukprot:9499137-Pyramimonas_sp.AAC.1